MTQGQRKWATVATGIFALAIAGLLALASSGCGVTEPCRRVVLETVYASTSDAFDQCPRDCASAGLSYRAITNAPNGWKCDCERCDG